MIRLNSWLLIISLGLGLIFSGSVLAADNDKSGAELYQFWCSTCHGDRGQGLTPEWRAEWPEGKQNCWQSKCHAANHPPDGFTIPKTVPALIGDDTLSKFNTAQDLYVYIRVTMPYWAPNILADEEYQAITIYLIEANYLNQGLQPPPSLPQEFTTVPLHPPTGLINWAQFTRLWPWLVVLVGLLAVAIGGWLLKRRTPQDTGQPRTSF